MEKTWRNPLPVHRFRGILRSLIFATLQSYIFARLRRITFSFGSVTATEIKMKLMFVLGVIEA